MFRPPFCTTTVAKSNIFLDRFYKDVYNVDENTPLTISYHSERTHPELYLDYPDMKLTVDDPVKEFLRLYNNFVNELSESRITKTTEIDPAMLKISTAYPAHLTMDGNKYYMVIESKHGDYDNFNKMTSFASDTVRAKGEKIVRGRVCPSVYEFYQAIDKRTKKINKAKKGIILHFAERLCMIEKVDYNELPYNRKVHYIRESVYNIYGKSYECTTHRPMLPAMVYQLFGAKKVLDFSSGWGDRMLAALAQGIEYHGVDPNPELQASYKFIIDNVKGNARVHCMCAEDYESDEVFDLMYTSPPYFTLEVYSKHKDQSTSKNATYDEWLNNFFYRMLKNAIKHVKQGGQIAVNIINWGQYKMLDDMIKFMLDNGQIFSGFIWYRGGREQSQVSGIAVFEVVK